MYNDFGDYMVYLIYGEQYPTVKKHLNKLKHQILGDEIDEFSFVSLSCKTTLIQDIVSEANKPALFSSRKMIVASEPYFLTTSKERVDIEKHQDYDVLKKYLQNPSEYSDLVFILEGTNISTRNELYKLINKHGKITLVEQMSQAQFAAVAGQYFQKANVKIEQSALDELVFRCGLDLSKFLMEANKLCLYSSHITLKDVETLVSLKPEQNAFAIAENLMKGNIKKALKIYYDLRILKEEPVRLIALMASQFRIITEVGFLLEEGGSKESIATSLGIHPYRVQLAINNLNYLSYRRGQLVLDYLYDLEYKIKSGQVSPYYGFEMFLLNFNEIK